MKKDPGESNNVCLKFKTKVKELTHRNNIRCN